MTRGLTFGLNPATWRQTTVRIDVDYVASTVIWRSFKVVYPAGKIGISLQVWCLIVSIPDLCPLSYFHLGTKIASFGKPRPIPWNQRFGTASANSMESLIPRNLVETVPNGIPCAADHPCSSFSAQVIVACALSTVLCGRTQ